MFRHSILFVEDEEGIRDIFLTVGAMVPNVNLITASNIKEAMEIYSHQHFDMIITDNKMPNGSGIELIDYIRKKSKIPITMLTAHLDWEEEQKIKDKKVRVILKPTDPFELFKDAVEFLEKHNGK